jgi:2-haloacid dehalogenase
MNIRVMAFDTGGTVLDWHGGLVRALTGVGSRHGIERDWHAMANDWRRRTMKHIVGQRQPAFHMDDVQRRVLDETPAEFDLDSLTAVERDALWRTWHGLDAWPDFAPALAALRKRLPVVSFTMLPTALVVNVSRRNGITWDAIISCEMIGVHKPHAEAYQTAARWLNLPPQDILMVAPKADAAPARCDSAQLRTPRPVQASGADQSSWERPQARRPTALQAA